MKSLYNRYAAAFTDLFVVGYNWTNFEKWSVNTSKYWFPPLHVSRWRISNPINSNGAAEENVQQELYVVSLS